MSSTNQRVLGVLGILIILNQIWRIGCSVPDPIESDVIEIASSEISTTTKRTLPDRCLIKAEPGPCKSYVHKWTFNKSSGKCRTFVYGGCLGNDNRFNSEIECLYYCVGGPEREYDHIMNHDEILFIFHHFSIQLFASRHSATLHDHKTW